MSVLRRTLQRLGLGAGPLLQQQLAGLEARLARSQQQQQDAQHALLTGLKAAQLQQRQLVERIEAQQQALEELRRQLIDTVKKEALNTARQVESFLSLQALLSENGGCVVPLMHGWPVSPDLALHVAMLLKTERYDQVIEFGSGSSTLVMARMLHQLGRGRLLTFEHLPAYRDQTAALLNSQALDGLVDLRLAPLVPRVGADGSSCSNYYDCEAALRATAQTLRASPSPKLLLFVDGPPAATGPRARQPALEAVLTYFSGCEIHVLLDDYIRQDEKEIVRRWEALLQHTERRYTHEELPLEKGASLLRIKPLAAAPQASETAAKGVGT